MKEKKICVEEAFFPVKLCYLYWGENVDEEEDWFCRQEHHYPPANVQICPRHFAVVNMDKKYVYQCVTDRYELVTNRDAVNVADAIAQIVFRKQRMMDFCNKTVKFEGVNNAQCCMEFWDEEEFFVEIDTDKWLPFVQIVNSYNSTATLSYELGFRICDADIKITFDEISIKIKDAHNKGVLKMLPSELIETAQKKGLDKMESIKNDFVRKMNILNNAFMSTKDIMPLALKLFELDYNKGNASKETCRNLKRAVDAGLREHFAESNMYYFVRLMAAIISEPLYFPLRVSMAQKYESKIGKLIDDLVRYLQGRNQGDNLKTFIGEQYYQMAKQIEADFRG